MCLISNYALFANLILVSNTISFQYSSLESIKDTFSTMSEIKGYEPSTVELQTKVTEDFTITEKGPPYYGLFGAS